MKYRLDYFTHTNDIITLSEIWIIINSDSQ